MSLHDLWLQHGGRNKDMINVDGNFAASGCQSPLSLAFWAGIHHWQVGACLR